ncbi:MAG: iron-containing alcohol dehydrogenase [Methylococcaceae bacterium]|nr:MAG: iron-containing alcohol dehydrogenase [Methylococcaceae bacterium]
MIQPFSIGKLPRIEFGSGSFAKLPGIAARYGQRLLLVTGARSFLASPHAETLFTQWRALGCHWDVVQVRGEPSPELVDAIVAEWRGTGINAVIGIGGGSVLDAAKACAGLLVPGNSVMDHLEGVGPELPYRGPATPFIAVPTTAGTGSEATKNAVLSRSGADGFKKSFRDDQLMAQYAIVDPDLLAGCPAELIAADGMDAYTQLLEAYVSLRANPLTDALALAGMKAVCDGLPTWYATGENAAAARTQMAYASLLSGICLAQAGLGSVHGLAQPLGSLFPIPHGVVCGTLVAAATRVNIEVMQARDPGNPALAKYADVGRLFSRDRHIDDAAARASLVDVLMEWTRTMQLPMLRALGISEEDLPRIIANCRGSSMKTNPVVLTDNEVERILRMRIG